MLRKSIGILLSRKRLMRYKWSRYLTIVVSHVGQIQLLPLWLWLKRVVLFQSTAVFGSDIAGIILE